MFQTFVVGSARKDSEDAKDQYSEDEVEQADGEASTRSKAPKNALAKAPTPKPKAAPSHGKTPGKSHHCCAALATIPIHHLVPLTRCSLPAAPSWV